MNDLTTNQCLGILAVVLVVAILTGLLWLGED